MHKQDSGINVRIYVYTYIYIINKITVYELIYVCKIFFYREMYVRMYITKVLLNKN